MINPDELEEPVPPLSHLLFDKVTALRQEIVQIRDQRDNADTVQAFQIATAKQALQIAAAKQALQDVTEAVAEMEIEIARLRAELKTSNAERDELRQQVETIKNGFEGGCYLCDLVAEARDEARLEVRALQKKIGDTSTMLYDWDGYYNPHSQSGNIVEMAKLVEEAYSTLQGRSWDCYERKETP